MGRLKKIIAILCVCTMSMNLVGEYGVGKVEVAANTVEMIADATVLYSGVSGDLDWSVDSNGCLTISGSGSYKIDTEWDEMFFPEWILYRDIITSAVVNVTELEFAQSMFDSLENLESVRFDEFETLNDELHALFMFYGCTSLKNVSFASVGANKLVDISYMFYGCTSLESVNLAGMDMENITYYDEVFGECPSLTSIWAPDNCSVEVELPEGYWYDENGNEYSMLPQNHFYPVKLTKGEKQLKSASVEINGFQISSVAKGIRTVYSVSDPNSEVVSAGLIYGLVDYASVSDMNIDTTNGYVYDYAATEGGKMSDEISAVFTELEDAVSYAMTMTFSNCSEEYFVADTMVRAYAKLSDGRYIYSPVYIYTVYDVADSLYTNNGMNNQTSHTYLYTDILSKVNSDYQQVEYKKGGMVVIP